MKHIVSFGCSYTYGSALPDCWEAHDTGNRAGPRPSQQAWPKLLGVNCKLPVTNYAAPGASSLEILYKIINYRHSANDVVIVLWTRPARTVIFNDTVGLQWPRSRPWRTARPGTPVGPWDQSSLTSRAYAVHTDTDFLSSYWLNVHHAITYLGNLKIPVINCFVDAERIGNPPRFIDPQTVDTDIGLGIGLGCLDFALDNQHPGVLTHQHFSNQLYTKYCNFING